MNHPAILTGDDIKTILDGCFTERMELVSRIRRQYRPPGLCPHGSPNRDLIACTLNHKECEYQVWQSCPQMPESMMICCGREKAALAVAEEPAVPCPKCGSPTFAANIDGEDTRLCMNDACKWKAAVAETAEQEQAGDHP